MSGRGDHWEEIGRCTFFIEIGEGATQFCPRAGIAIIADACGEIPKQASMEGNSTSGVIGIRVAGDPS